MKFSGHTQLKQQRGLNLLAENIHEQSDRDSLNIKVNQHKGHIYEHIWYRDTNLGTTSSVSELGEQRLPYGD